MSMPPQALCRFRNAAATAAPHSRAHERLVCRASRPRSRLSRGGTGNMQSAAFRAVRMRGPRPGSDNREYAFLIL